jgi:hypothetical protein
VSLRSLELVNVTGEYQQLTWVLAVVTISTGKGRNVGATCERSGGGAPNAARPHQLGAGEGPDQVEASTDRRKSRWVYGRLEFNKDRA